MPERVSSNNDCRTLLFVLKHGRYQLTFRVWAFKLICHLSSNRKPIARRFEQILNCLPIETGSLKFPKIAGSIPGRNQLLFLISSMSVSAFVFGACHVCKVADGTETVCPYEK